MPYYPTRNRKPKLSKTSKSLAKTHSRECVSKQSVKSQKYTKESIREVTLKLMALMKAKRECQPVTVD